MQQSLTGVTPYQEIVTKFGTPVWIYNAAIIERQIMALRAFDVVRYAQKANSNIHILKLMKSHGVHVDAVSKGELERALLAGYTTDELVLTTDLLDRKTLDYVVEELITVNAGSIDMLRQVGERSRHHKVWIRVNPGFGHGHSPKVNTGGENSKHGIWHSDLDQAIDVIDHYNLDLKGVHMHIGSGVDYGHLQRVGQSMVDIIKTYHLDVSSISAGGGLSIPYRSSDHAIDVHHYFQIWDLARRDIEQYLGHRVTLEIEPGRYLVAQSGELVGEVRAVKTTGSGNQQVNYALIDVGFNELIRPAMYGSYHRLSAMGPDFKPLQSPLLIPTVVAGPVCESCDVFTQGENGELKPQNLPPLNVGDYIVIHDAGAYGASMSSNYNSRPLCPEFMIGRDSEALLIRRPQTISQLLDLEL